MNRNFAGKEVHLRQVGVSDLELFRHVAAQVGVHDIGHPHEVLEEDRAGLCRNAEIDASLGPVERLEEEAVLTLLVRWHVTADVASEARVLEFDDVGSEVGKVQRTERTCTVLFDGDHSNIRQRLHSRVARSIFLYIVPSRTR